MSDHEHTEHIVTPGTYLAIIITLLVLTGVTVFAAYVNLGRFNIVVALGIASIKATLVVLYFMHAKFSPKRTRLVIIAAVFWLAILLLMTLSDYLTRINFRGDRFPMMQNISLSKWQRG